MAHTEATPVDDNKPSLKDRAKLFGTGFLQVIFVAANTVFISRYALIGNVITAFMISLIWTFNVKRVAFGDTIDRYFYATGAALGSVVGTVIANNILS